MSGATCTRVQSICSDFENDPDRLLDVLHAIQRAFGAVATDEIREVAASLRLPTERVDQTVTHFSAFTRSPRGRLRIRVADDPVARMLGSGAIGDRVADELVGMGTTHASLERVSCLGTADLGPVLWINDTIVPVATHEEAGRAVRNLARGSDVAGAAKRERVPSRVRMAGRIVLGPTDEATAVRRALSMSPAEVIRSVKTARLRGRGLDSLPSGIKWSFARSATIERAEHDWGEQMASSRDYAREFDRFTTGEKRYVICNACDCEPGLSVAGVLMGEHPRRVFAGMAITAYAIGAEQGIVYLAEELAGLKPDLERELANLRLAGLIGDDIAGRRGFGFDIRIVLGSGPYALGEETAVINACEGRPSVPRPRPPFPTQAGYRGWPTIVHGPELLCCVAKIMELGPATFAELGTPESTGTKVLCLSGDCRAPGLFEVPFGVTLDEVLGMAGAEDAETVFVSGPSPALFNRSRTSRRTAYEDVACSGAIVAAGARRDPVRLLADFGRFYLDATDQFRDEQVKDRSIVAGLLGRLAEGQASRGDLGELVEAAGRIADAPDSGFGRTAGRFVLASIESLRPGIEDRLARAGSPQPHASQA
ncbi:MAG: NAD(P)H-dependent oxidoreductase subunit E [Phycisphaeraceae bacterium]|nr:MAG: NAD(P)H-dependent oxidoreductase subunit E [Phycisphaeraceae bacterium]